MAKKQSYEDIFKEVQALEDEISVLTGKINESVRNLVQFETEANNLLVNWRELAIQGQKAPNCLKEIENINAKDIDEQKKYDRFRKEKDDKQQELRKKVLTLLKTPQPAHHPDERKKDVIDLQKSSLISGTSKSSIDEVDFSRLFKHFVNDEAQVPIEITRWQAKKTKGKKGKKEEKETKYDPSSKLSKKNPYYGEVYKGRAMGKNVCVKILTKLDKNQVAELHRNYESMRKMTSHPHLLSPVSASKQEGEPKVLVDLAEGPYPSLQDFINAKEKREERIGFLTKLRFSKNICSAMAWLHGTKVLHLRLKPTNILFTKDWKIKVSDYGLDLPPVPEAPEGWIKSGHAYFYPPELLEDRTKKSNAVDVYSFGLVLYSLLTEQFPYKEAKTIEELKKLINEKPVELDDKLYPPSIIALMKSCIHKNPAERTTFVNLASDECWSKIYQDMVSAGNEKGQALWMTAANQQQANAIPWDVFAPVLWKELGITSPDPLQLECVKTMLYLENSNVLHKNWMRFLMWFSPLITGNEGSQFIKKVVELLQSKWFYGREFDRVMSDALMNKILNNKTTMEKNKGKQPFLVRIAISQEEKFCLVCFTPDKKINHVPIAPKDYVDIGIHKYITDMAKKKSWFPTEEERPLETQIFSKITRLDSSDMTVSGGENQVRSVVQPNSIVGTTKYI